MDNNKQTDSAVKILHDRYVGDDPVRQAELKEERVNAQVARAIYSLRRDSGLTQKQLADLVGTTQSVISRLEDADYEGHSLTMINRIAGVLNRRLSIQILPADKSA